MRSRKTRIEHWGRASLAIAIVSCLPPLQARAQSAPTQDARSTFDIRAGSLAAALDQFAAQTGIQTLFQPDLLAGKQASALSGQMTWREALTRLLRGSGLEYRQVNATTVAIRPAGQPPKSGAGPSGARPSGGSGASAKPVTDMQSVTVTGTRIRGGTTPSPVITIGSEDIQEEGFSDLGEVIRSVPQNFAGGQNPGVFSLNFSGGGLQNQNVTGGSTLNLRGLGPDATLTLLNGRRLAYGGFSQAVDISSIPVEAVERIEIVADGASAIYGSDAVGGVGNVILARDFDGVTIGARYGEATEGGLLTREYTATAGTTWTSGGLIATYKDAAVDPIYARQRDYGELLTSPSTLYPESDLHSGLFSIHQSLGDYAEFHLDALRSKRDQRYDMVSSGTNFHATPNTTTSLLSPGIDFSLPGDWTLFVGGTWGKDEHMQIQSTVDLATGVSTPQNHACYCNESRSYEIGGEGRVFDLPAGEARLALGAGYRENEFEKFEHLTDTRETQGRESSRFAYGEISVPLLGSSFSSLPRLAVTAAVRTEDYASYGKVTTPKLGAVYLPSADFTVKASWGKSFKMPTLYQLNKGQLVTLVLPAWYGGTGFAPDATMLTLSGGNRDLKPERARTWTASLGFHPEALPGLDMTLTWFDIRYTDRVIEPITNPAEAMSNPTYAQFVSYSPTDEEKARLVSIGQMYNYVGVAYDPNKVVAILYDEYLNASDQHIKGTDLSGSYPFQVGSGQLTLRGSVSWLDSSQTTSATSGEHGLAGTLYNPAKINGRIGTVWTRHGLSASLFATYVAGVTNTADGRKGASFTTFDATVRYSTGTRKSLWSNVDFTVAVQNLLDRHPPLYSPANPLVVAPYDSSNYSAIGRFLSVAVSKHW